MTPEETRRLIRIHNTNVILTVGVVILIAIEFFSIHRKWTSELRMEREITLLENRAHQSNMLADSLVKVADGFAEQLRVQEGLSLRLALEIDSINEVYDDEFITTLSSAGRAELHRMSDSLLAGFDVNRHRYAVLLRSRSPGDDREHEPGAARP